jgi:hypothetical protein
MKKTLLLLFLFPATMIQSCIFAGKNDLVLQNLTCEYTHDPSGIDVMNPALGWQTVSERQTVNQSAYRMVSMREPSGWLYMVKDEKSTMGECLCGRPDTLSSGAYEYVIEKNN